MNDNTYNNNNNSSENISIEQRTKTHRIPQKNAESRQGTDKIIKKIAHGRSILTTITDLLKMIDYSITEKANPDHVNNDIDLDEGDDDEGPINPIKKIKINAEDTEPKNAIETFVDLMTRLKGSISTIENKFNLNDKTKNPETLHPLLKGQSIGEMNDTEIKNALANLVNSIGRVANIIDDEHAVQQLIKHKKNQDEPKAISSALPQPIAGDLIHPVENPLPQAVAELLPLPLPKLFLPTTSRLKLTVEPA